MLSSGQLAGQSGVRPPDPPRPVGGGAPCWHRPGPWEVGCRKPPSSRVLRTAFPIHGRTDGRTSLLADHGAFEVTEAGSSESLLCCDLGGRSLDTCVPGEVGTRQSLSLLTLWDLEPCVLGPLHRAGRSQQWGPPPLRICPPPNPQHVHTYRSLCQLRYVSSVPRVVLEKEEAVTALGTHQQRLKRNPDAWFRGCHPPLPELALCDRPVSFPSPRPSPDEGHVGWHLS